MDYCKNGLGLTFSMPAMGRVRPVAATAVFSTWPPAMLSMKGRVRPRANIQCCLSHLTDQEVRDQLEARGQQCIDDSLEEF